jgi:hypothetical protein
MFLLYVALSLIQGDIGISSGRGRWLSDLLIQTFGKYGFVGAEFLAAIFAIYKGFSTKD